MTFHYTIFTAFVQCNVDSDARRSTSVDIPNKLFLQRNRLKSETIFLVMSSVGTARGTGPIISVDYHRRFRLFYPLPPGLDSAFGSKNILYIFFIIAKSRVYARLVSYVRVRQLTYLL